jgi:alpha-D-xyloside xylohydrolase
MSSRLPLSLLALILFFLPRFAANASVSINPVTRSVTIITDSGITRVQPWLPGTVRIESAPGKTIPEKKSLAVIAAQDTTGWQATQDTASVTLKSPRMRVVVHTETGLISIFKPDGTPLLEETAQNFKPAQNPSRDGLEITTTFHRVPDEHFFGGGVVGAGKIKGDDDLRDPTAQIKLEQSNAHISIPILYSSLGYGFFWDNPSRGKINLTPDSVTWHSSAGDLADFYVMAGPTADQSIAEYRKLTGAAPLFPKWAYGFWFCRNKFNSQDEILKAASDFRAKQFPVDLIVQDYFYWKPNFSMPDDTAWGSHKFSEERYPDPKGMIEQLHDQYHFHFMAVIWAKFNPATDHFKELDAIHGLFPPQGDWAGQSLQYYDAFNPEARKIYGRQVMDSLFSIGVDAFWMDGTEPEIGGDAAAGMDKVQSIEMPEGAVSRVMDAFPQVHVSSVYNAQRAVTDRKRVVLLPRSAWAGSQRYAASDWTGDIGQDWKDLAWQIEGLANYSITGLPYITTDTGGYSPTSESDTELFVRWFQWGTFCPIFRVHGENRPFPWEYGADAEAILKKFDLLRYRLLPYIYTQASQITFHGGTIMRPLVMDFQDDPKALETWDEFMFGPSILVCPVHQKGLTQRDVYLPGKEDWYDFWTGERTTGGQSKMGVPAPMDHIPLYVRAGSILSMGPELQYVAEKPADPIELRIYRGADGRFTLYEDEGDSYDYEKGAFSQIPMSWNEATQTLTIGNRKGTFPGMIAQRTFHVICVKEGHGIGEDVTATADKDISYRGRAVAVSFAGSK